MASSLGYWPSSAAIAESANDAIISTNLDGTIATWNRAAGAIFGYRPEEVIGRPVFLLAAPGREDEMPVILDQIKRGQRIEHYETVRRHKDGRQVAISVTVSPIRADNGRIVGTSKIARDITERKQAEAERRRLNETLEQRVAERTAELEELTRKLRAEIVERERADAGLRQLQLELFHAARLNTAGHMAEALAHELNQPLAAAINFVRAAQRQLATGNRNETETVPQVMDEAAGEVLRAGQIIRRLRDFVRRGETERRIESVVPMVEEASAFTSIRAAASGVRVHLSFDPNAARMLADRIQIQQVLVNLMLNAIDAMGDSSRRELEVKTALLDDETTEFSVTDSGTGLAAEVADRLFEPFVSTKPNGMGLGLSICRSIVEAHGGRLRAEPNEGGGTIFCFTLPAFPPQVTTMEAEPTIHIVDDDGAVRRSLECLLHAAGFKSIAYETALGFLDAAPGASAGCVLLDVRMPEMDGLELQARLNRLGCPLRVIVMTGGGEVDDAVRAMKAGAVDFIEKPFDDERLFGAIEEALVVSERSARNREAAEAAVRLGALSPRERQVLHLLMAGRPNKVIAYDLGISVRTVEVHRARMLRRLGTRSGAEAIQLAVMAAWARQSEGVPTEPAQGARTSLK